MRVRIIGAPGSGFNLGSRAVYVGEVVEMDDATARIHIAQGVAVCVDESVALTPEPAPDAPKPASPFPPERGVVDPDHVLHKPEPERGPGLTTTSTPMHTTQPSGSTTSRPAASAPETKSTKK